MDVRPYLDRLRERSRQILRERRERVEEVRAHLPEVVRVLRDEFGVRRVLLFGSLLDGRLHAGSDVDLAVEGLHPGAYWQALDRVASLLGCSVDLIRLEEVPPGLREAAEQGEVLHVD